MGLTNATFVIFEILNIEISMKFQTYPEFSSHWFSQKIFFFVIFFVENFTITIIHYGETKKVQLSVKRVIAEQAWWKFSIVVLTWRTFDLVAFKVILRWFGAFAIFRSLVLNDKR